MMLGKLGDPILSECVFGVHSIQPNPILIAQQITKMIVWNFDLQKADIKQLSLTMSIK